MKIIFIYGKKVFLPQKELILRFCLILFFIIFPAFSQLKISEVMRNPIGNETEIPGGRSHEYIEIVNLSDETINLVGMRLFDGQVYDQIIEIPKNTISQGLSGVTELKPGQIGLILDRDIFPIYDLYPLNIPDSTAIFTVNKASICGGLAADDGFIILDGNDTVAECKTEIDNEKIKCVAEGNEPDGYSIVPTSLLQKNITWKTEIASAGKIKNYNFGVLREYEISRKNDKFECKILYRNFGKNAFIENKKIEKSGEILLTKELASRVIFEWKIEEKTIFDTISTANLYVKENSVVITEVDSRAATEWIELYWTSECFDLENWHLIIGGSVVNLPKIECPKNRILVVGEKNIEKQIENAVVVSNWRKINNYDDTIFLAAPFGIVDSIAWTRDIFVDSRDKNTIQRKNPKISGFDKDNIFTGRATPGALLAVTEIKKFEIELSSKKFTPNGDNNLDSLVITAKKPQNGNVKIEIYGMDGNLLRTFESASQIRFVWDGKTESGRLAQIGPIFVIGTFDDKNSKFSDRKNAVLWR
jgi:hypothetical protein